VNQQEDFILTGIAYNGLETLRQIEEQSPDVVVLDIIMPHLDGIGVLEKTSCRWGFKYNKTQGNHTYGIWSGGIYPACNGTWSGLLPA